MSILQAAETFTGQLKINNVVTRGPAWYVLSYYPLWSSPAVRGQDRLLPGVAGVIPNPRRVTVTVVDLAMVFVGDVDKDGVPPEGCDDEDYAIQLEENIDYFMTNVVVPPGGNGTQAAELTMPSGATRTGDLHVLGLDLTGGGHDITGATLSLSIPVGALT